jgi:GNAT superfamily N-acetyltransferase
MDIEEGDQFMATIAYLADYPQFLPTLAAWIYDEWDHLTPGYSIADLEAKLQTHLKRDAIPLTLVAVADGQAVGTACIQEEDLPSRPDLSPWLAAVYVPPAYRRQGIGAQLVRAIEDNARRLKIGALYLFTPDKEQFYSGLGWSVIDRAEYRARRVVVMKKELG